MTSEKEAAPNTGPLPRLLVAEDNPSNYLLVEVLLRRSYALTHAEDGQQAVACFRRDGADLILMDINMPVMDGYEALARIREIDPSVPVIALTAYAFETDRLKMVEAGFDACVTKPIRADELKQTIAALVGR